MGSYELLVVDWSLYILKISDTKMNKIKFFCCLGAVVLQYSQGFVRQITSSKPNFPSNGLLWLERTHLPISA